MKTVEINQNEQKYDKTQQDMHLPNWHNNFREKHSIVSISKAQ